ncbi:MAG: hypothetical protein KatS3mg078_1831 [Deltaproteobacteria bacterium]|jgi:hypothetical protein|nr:MAG: hypothetical protein KatS3mg078_1831 [Deltaproteobacteria bacterium]
MKTRERIWIKVRKPVPKKPTRIILSKKEKLSRKRIKHRELLKEVFEKY